MKKSINPNKLGFINVIFKIAEQDSSSIESAKELIESEDKNVQKLLSDGLKEIKKRKLLIEAERTQKEMESAELVKEAATNWVDNLLSNIDFSLPELVKSEELTMSFRNVENLSQEDIRAILIRHFTLKFMNRKEGE